MRNVNGSRRVVLLFVVVVVLVVVHVVVALLVLAVGSCRSYQTFLLSVNYGSESTLSLSASAPCVGRLVSVSRSG